VEASLWGDRYPPGGNQSPSFSRRDDYGICTRKIISQKEMPHGFYIKAVRANARIGHKRFQSVRTVRICKKRMEPRRHSKMTISVIRRQPLESRL
jgi:hypothetical protein